MYPHPLRVEWNKKYKEAAIAFFAINSLGVLVFVAAVAIAARLVGDIPGTRERMIGIIVAMVGAMLAIGTGLVNKWRWAAIAALLWCLLWTVLTIIGAAVAADEPVSNAGQRPASAGPGVAGLCCPAIFAVILMVTCARAAFASAPPKEELPAAAPVSSAPFNPYGVVQVQERKSPAVALVLIGIGVFVTVAGAGLFAKGFVDQEQAATLEDAPWQRYGGDGFTVEFPGTPAVKDWQAVGEGIETSHVYELTTAFHNFAVQHTRAQPGYEPSDDALVEELDHIFKQAGGVVIHRETPDIGDRALKYYTEDSTNGTRTVMLAVVRNRDLYVVIGSDGTPDAPEAVTRFVNSFQVR